MTYKDDNCIISIPIFPIPLPQPLNRIRTALRNIAGLPSDQRIRRVTPRAGFFSAGITAEIFRPLHFGENVERRTIVRMRLLGIPSLARDAVSCHAHVALVKTATSFDARGYRILMPKQTNKKRNPIRMHDMKEICDLVN